jgi:ribonuclease D
MHHSQLITTSLAFEGLCDEIESAGIVAFDTEFVSEFTYRPELCLLQFATPKRAVAVDPFEVRDLDRWWRIMAEGRANVIVHGSREEVRFCLRYAGQRPPKIWDVQIAEGLESRGFPLSYSSLVARVLGKTTSGKETRTDWRKRPLTDRQIHYAVEDVQHLIEIYETQQKTLGARGRVEWAQTEIERFLDEIEAESTREAWRKLSGTSGFSSRELAVARELWAWREREAEGQDRPARKILRDDLLVELVKRQPADTADLLATRDMNRSDYRRMAPQMIGAIQKAKALPASALPTVRRNDKDHDEQILAQLLGMALANRCAQQEVAMQLVGTSSDLKHLVRWHVYGERTGDPPKILSGWRSDVCGALLTDVLEGRVALRISDPQSDHPLTFIRLDGPQEPLA